MTKDLDVVLFGEAMAMFIADDYLPLEEANHYTRALAGAELNVSVGLVQLGFSVGWISRLGPDPLGCGSEVVKVFPASTVGPGFLRELKGPLGFIPLYPTGGITLENASAFLDAGAVAVGVGSALVKKEWIAHGDWNALRHEATAWAKLKCSG